MILFTALLLIATFSLHVLIWRVRTPAKTLLTLVSLFFIVMLCVDVAGYESQVEITQLVRFSLLFFSCALVYIILYTAIEKQSPTLAIIQALYRAGLHGLSEDELRAALSIATETDERFFCLQQSKWINVDNESITLTKHGKMIAALFACSAKIFHLEKGG